MTRSTAGLAVVLGLTVTAPGWAAAPQIKETSPLGVQKGIATEVTITGANLAGNPQLIAPFPFTAALPEKPSTDAASWKVKLEVAPGTPLGTYPIRIKTDDGLSNPWLFTVGQLPQVAEKEDNNTFDAAQAIPSPVVVEGTAAGNDVDYYRFPGKKGERIVIDAQCSRIGSGVDPSIRLTTAARKYVASADDSPGLLTDARLATTLPEDTDYVIEISDSRYQGGARPVYRLIVGAVPMAEEIYPIGARAGETIGFELRGGTLPDLRLAAASVQPDSSSTLFAVRATNTALGLAAPGGPVLDVESIGPLEVSEVPELREPTDPAAPPVRAATPVALNGRIDPAGDEDRFTLAVTPGQALRIEVSAAESGSALDGVLQVLGAKDAVLATADDTNLAPRGRQQAANAQAAVSPDPSLNFTVPAGTSEITLALRDLESRGGIGFPYRITVVPVTPSFDITLNDSQVSVPKGGSALVGVAVVRKGYTGPITVTVPNPPRGLTVRPGSIGAGQLVGVLSVSAAPDAAFGAVNLNVVGQAQDPSGPIVVAATKAMVYAQQGTLPTNTMIQRGLAAAPALATAITLDAPATPVEVVHGYGTAVPIKLARNAGADTELAVTPLPLPPGVAVPAAKLAAKAAEGTVTVNVGVEAPLGAVTVGLLAKGKIDKADQTIAVPAVTLDVVRPASVELASPNLEVKAGTTAELKGKVIRRGPFKEPVTLNVNGLPAGLKAEPVKVEPDKSEFTIAVVAEPKAAATQTGANIGIAFEVNKKGYSTPALPLAVKVTAGK